MQGISFINYQRSTMRAGTGAGPLQIDRLSTLNSQSIVSEDARTTTLKSQLSIDRERGRSHYNSQL
ncbi:MAG: hypothetical protein ACRC62_31955 [Microcoleus sp.]